MSWGGFSSSGFGFVECTDFKKVWENLCGIRANSEWVESKPMAVPIANMFMGEIIECLL